MTSIERTAYPRFKRLITAHELHLFFSPTRDEVAWASGATDCDEHLLGLVADVEVLPAHGVFPEAGGHPGDVGGFRPAGGGAARGHRAAVPGGEDG
ncbi:DUF4158 domain-containing protein [Streptomyces sp. NPDC007905]|uniref:DUF4158 domain-containing protein n=1 Tax=Streptomyces sp. NPDC007905 TaxID=3364788 RepID=UPI0036EBA7AB